MSESVPTTTNAYATVSDRKWASKQVAEVLKKEAFINTLKASLNNLSKDIKVGSRFISTLDYDGNLYECKQEPYEDLMSKTVFERVHYDNNKIRVREEAHRILPQEVDITALIDKQYRYKYSKRWTPYTDEKNSEEFFEKYIGHKITLTRSDITGDAISASSDIRMKNYYMRDDRDDDMETPKEIDFVITDVHTEATWFAPLGSDERQQFLNYKALGYFPEIQRQVLRIWVRKCNVVAEALGKNIDSSRRCINFTLEQMNVREMLQDERDKLMKVRKIFNKNNPPKSRSAILSRLTDEAKRLEPSLKRLETLIEELYKQDIKVPAYYCRKYGFLIPLRATVIVDLSGNTLEQELVQKNDEAKAKIDEQVNLRNQVVEEVLPYALHPDRVEKAIQKYDSIEAVFGDDVPVAVKWSEGKKSEGVVNKSVFG
jgi:hypothetical protein